MERVTVYQVRCKWCGKVTDEKLGTWREFCKGGLCKAAWKAEKGIERARQNSMNQCPICRGGSGEACTYHFL